jgi:hypothetical protein
MLSVLDLTAAGCAASELQRLDVANRVDALEQDLADNEELRKAVAMIHRRANHRAAELPVAGGRPAVRLEALLAGGPTAINPSSVAPVVALARAQLVIDAAGSAMEAITEEAEVVSAALTSDLTCFEFDAMREVTEAVLGLSRVSRAVGSWASPAGADAADRLLTLAADDLRAAARSHTLLYERFTEDVWRVPGALLDAGRSRWRLVTRTRLRRHLRAVSRSGRVPGRLSAVAAQVLEARSDRQPVTALSNLLAHNLGHLDRGPLTDVDAAQTALAAVRRLHGALGGHVDDARLQELLRADAFHSREVIEPVENLRNALRAWSEAVTAAGGIPSGTLGLEELARWTAECARLLPTVAASIESAAALEVVAPTLRDLVDMLVLRERIEDVVVDARPHRSPFFRSEL